MVEVVFLSSTQGYQADRVAAIADRLRKERPDLKVSVEDPAASGPLLVALKLRFGPAVLIGGRVEFVGVPRYRMLVERIAKSVERGKAPPAGPPAAPPRAPAPPAGPGG
ncbi:MAG: hypothetical protein A3K66_00060 [Euryarchaeota archaeon RBG_16_67_27]|nr:MAG: hypothetical protein A3K66_00060 [Euryarchaeota archaeon RBG_16_67_27]